MDRFDLMKSVERRAFDARIELTALCNRAKISPNAASRWRTKQIAPRLSTIGKLEAVLTEIESGGAIGSSAGTNGTGPSTEQED